jgi:hypothetical protein
MAPNLNHITKTKPRKRPGHNLSGHRLFWLAFAASMGWFAASACEGFVKILLYLLLRGVL